MELPASVRQALAEVAPDLALQAPAPNGADDVLRMVLLEDDQGQLQVICREQALLDLAALNKQLGRDLRLLSRKHQAQLRQRLGLLRDIPPVPPLTGWPTIVDAGLDQLGAVALGFTDQDCHLPLNAEAFQRLTAGARRLPIAVSLANIRVNLDRPEEDREQLHSAIKRFTGLRIRQRLDDTLELPPLPETAQRIIHLRVNPNAVMGDLVDVVESDPSLAAQVVSWASSSFYAAAGQVRSVHDAVSRVLGFDLVMNLAMGLALGRALKQPADQPEGYLGYWQQAIWQAQSAGILASMMRRGERPAFGLAYLAGLLHNFGYLVLAQVFPPHFKLACRTWEANPHLDTAIVEHYLLGVTREQIGAQLMSNWGMPEEIVVALRHQKNPDFQGEHKVYAKLLWLGRQLLIARGVPLGAAEYVPDSLYQELGLERGKVEEQFDELVASRDSIMAMAGMMAS
ncbi:MAG: HDOD domain-containing protein [Marinobacter sp.]|uniref:aminoacyl-tRNA deacylase and HDOD domain-containing protein n=1 Tax=Marinobacter sp. TaxID=50741 RepID=UPI00299EA35B|nr:HDOD domain-containing protein [Marinobacter sp.]MDX1635403.1 HDOD domain-containing protein [Marinobacter sp.]